MWLLSKVVSSLLIPVISSCHPTHHKHHQSSLLRGCREGVFTAGWYRYCSSSRCSRGGSTLAFAAVGDSNDVVSSNSNSNSNINSNSNSNPHKSKSNNRGYDKNYNTSMMGGKLESPSAERNKGPIAEILQSLVWPKLIGTLVASTNPNAIPIQTNHVHSDLEGSDLDHSSSTTSAAATAAIAAAGSTTTTTTTTTKYSSICEIRVLEVAAGAGVHTHYLCMQLATNYPLVSAMASATELPLLFVRWIPTDMDAHCRQSQDAYIMEENMTLLRGNGSMEKQPPSETLHSLVQQGRIPVLVEPSIPLTLQTHGIQESVTDQLLASHSMDLIININMIHISPWSATVGLFHMAASKLHSTTGLLLLYGPFREHGTCVESNQLCICIAFF
jgi:hypothetical protein